MSCSDFHSKLNEFRCDSKYCDVNVQVQEVNFPCHRVVLAAASQYFEAMFGGCFKEKHDPKIILQDMEAVTFENLLCIVYTGKESIINSSNVHHLIEAALFLRINSIEKSCAEFILKNLSSISHHIDVFRLVRPVNMTDLTDGLSSYIIHNFKSFYDDERFMEMPFDDLNFFLNKWVNDKLPIKHENLLLDLLIRWIRHAQEERKEYSKQLVKLVNFERISPEYITFLLEYFKNVEVLDFESTSGINIEPPMKRSESNFELSHDEKSKNRLLLLKTKISKFFKKNELNFKLSGIEYEVPRNRSLLKEKISNYFTANEEVTIASSSDSVPVMTSPFQNPNFHKNELGLHVCFEFNQWRWRAGEIGQKKTEHRMKKVFSLTKYRPDWFLSCETNSSRGCSERHAVSLRDTADTIYSLEIFEDEQSEDWLSWSFCTYSSIDMSLPSNILTPPPIDLGRFPEFRMCATKNDIFVLSPCARGWDEPQLPVYCYNFKKDEWFPIKRKWHKNYEIYNVDCMTADDHLVYFIGEKTHMVALDYRAATEIRLPNCQYQHEFSHQCGSLNGNIYVGTYWYWEMYDRIAGKWRGIESPELRHIKYGDPDYYYETKHLLQNPVPYENMFWCITKIYSANLPRTYTVSSYNPISEEWYISDSLNTLVSNHVETLKNENGCSYYVDHDIKDVTVFKTP